MFHGLGNTSLNYFQNLSKLVKTWVDPIRECAAIPSPRTAQRRDCKESRARVWAQPVGFQNNFAGEKTAVLGASCPYVRFT